MDEETLYTLLEERGIKVLEEDAEPTLDVDSIMAEVENAENNNDDMGISEDEEEDVYKRQAHHRGRRLLQGQRGGAAPDV